MFQILLFYNSEIKIIAHAVQTGCNFHICVKLEKCSNDGGDVEMPTVSLIWIVNGNHVINIPESEIGILASNSGAHLSIGIQTVC